MNKKVFLGGTTDSNWRDKLIPMLKIDYFNPLVDDWTPECEKQELEARESCDYCLYVITPKMTVFVESVANVVDDSNKRPEKTIFCYTAEDDGASLSEHQKNQLSAVFKLVESNGATIAYDLKQVAEILNKLNEERL